MAQIVGKYQYVWSENFEKYIRSLNKNVLNTVFLESKPKIEIKQNGDEWTIVVIECDKIGVSTFKLGKYYKEQLPSETKDCFLHNITTMEGNNLKTVSDITADLKSIRIYEFTDNEMIVHLSSNKNDIEAKRVYKRL